MEFMKNGEGQVIPGAIPVVYYTSLTAPPHHRE